MEYIVARNIVNTRFYDYIALLKPRVMSLVVFTGAVGMFLAPGHLSFVAAFTVLLSIALGGGAAGAMNMWLERHTDALMERTKNRPLPAGRIAAHDAIQFAVLCAIIAIVMLACATNFFAAALLAAAILYYVVIYTLWLKPRTPMNIVIGGAAGAFPPVIGWVAVTGNLAIEPLLLFLIIFLWTPPHFWALALVKAGDYAKAGIPMLPLTAGLAATTRQMLYYTMLVLPASLLPCAMGMTGNLYGAGALGLGLGFIAYAARIAYTKNLRYAMPMFAYSLLYLTGIFSLLVVDRLL